MIWTFYKSQWNINLLGESIQGHWVMSGPTSTTWHTPSPRPNHIYHPASYTTSITYIQRLRNVSLEENVNFSILRSIHKSFAFYMRLQMPGSYRGLRHSWYIQPFGCQTHLLSLCFAVILLPLFFIFIMIACTWSHMFPKWTSTYISKPAFFNQIIEKICYSIGQQAIVLDF